jgi:hypothetical protein
MWAGSAVLTITADQQVELKRIVRSGKTAQRVALRARIVLGAANGRSTNALAKALKTSRPTVLDWRQRFAAGGRDRALSGSPAGTQFQGP